MIYGGVILRMVLVSDGVGVTAAAEMSTVGPGGDADAGVGAEAAGGGAEAAGGGVGSGAAPPLGIRNQAITPITTKINKIISIIQKMGNPASDGFLLLVVSSVVRLVFKGGPGGPSGVPSGSSVSLGVSSGVPTVSSVVSVDPL